MKYSIILASSEALVGHAYSYSDTVSSFTEGSLTAESTVLRKSCPIPYTQLLLNLSAMSDYVIIGGHVFH